VSAESTAIEPATWDGCIHVEHGPVPPTQEPSVVWAVDAAPKHDSTAAVGVARDEEMIVLVQHRIWTPRGGPLDFALVEDHLRYLHASYRGRFVFDPYQLHSTMMRLQDDGLDVAEYPQTSQNLTKAAETLLDLLRTQRLALYADDELRQQALNATVVESPRGIRITKAVASRKVDAIVALAMACAVCVETPARAPVALWGR
jgi:phage terminase large subunit-like protein